MLLSRRSFIKGLAAIATTVALPVEIIEQISQVSIPDDLPVSSKYPPGFLEIDGLLISCYDLQVTIPAGSIGQFCRPTKPGRFEIAETCKFISLSCYIMAAVDRYTMRTLERWEGQEFKFALRPYSINPTRYCLAGCGYLQSISYDALICPPRDELDLQTIEIEGWDWDYKVINPIS